MFCGSNNLYIQAQEKVHKLHLLPLILNSESLLNN